MIGGYQLEEFSEVGLEFKQRNMTGTSILMQWCDGKLMDDYAMKQVVMEVALGRDLNILQIDNIADFMKRNVISDKRLKYLYDDSLLYELADFRRVNRKHQYKTKEAEENIDKIIEIRSTLK